MRDLLAILGPGTACHIVAQSNPGDACRLLLSIDVNVFEEIVSSLNVEAIASFFLVKDKQLFSLLDHRRVHTCTHARTHARVQCRPQPRLPTTPVH